MDPTPTLFGLLEGFLVGLTGVGGDSLMTPYLIAVMVVSAPTAVGLRVGRWLGVHTFISSHGVS
jgi:uncharacterized membrane protein YfcA